MNYTIEIQSSHATYKKEYTQPVTLAYALQDAGLSQDRPCGGHGRCGKCAVQVTGSLSAIGETERETLAGLSLPDGWRLACVAQAIGDVTIYYNIEKKHLQGVTEGFSKNFTDFLAQRKQDDKSAGVGLAVDIGTTSVAAYLFNLTTGVCQGQLCVANPQREHGADVISRIEYTLQNGGTWMRDAICQCIRSIKQELCQAAGIKSIEKCVITGNTTMLHLLTETDPSPLSAAPFAIRRFFGEWEGDTYYPRCISAYVGADITTAILFSGMCRDPQKTSLLLDIGTNGEMALWHAGKLTCCSTAAGPAFEGAGISCGSLAVDGAICTVAVRDGKIVYETIGNAPAVGVCGTGLIDTVAALLETGDLDETGFLEEDAPIGESGCSLTRKDIRQVQLAKSAIRSGVDTLLAEAGIRYDDLDTLYLAGGFGSYLHPATCAAIGLIPQELVEKIQVLGNAAGLGAAMILLSDAAREESERLAATATTIELSRNPIFMDKYVENMMF